MSESLEKQLKKQKLDHVMLKLRIAENEVNVWTRELRRVELELHNLLFSMGIPNETI
jgi:hypothetical protein